MKTPSVLLAATVVALAADAPSPKAGDIAKNYAKLLTRVTETPKVMGRELMAPCASPFQRDKLKAKLGPHVPGWMNYYRNDLAQGTGVGALPVGSVIVKEKQVRDRDVPSKPGEQPLKTQAIAGMIKRPGGTFPKAGDWEFFWFEDGQLSATGLESCAGCHSGAKRDYVFTDLPNKAK
jgi:hypothetical protein